MAEQSGFFDAHLVNGEYDRVYLSEHFAKYFASFIGNGIFGGKSNELMVRERGTPSMGVRVLSGQAWIDGYWYENTDELPLAIDIADGVLHRIDSIVVRWNHSERIIRLAVKKGIAATNPVAPVLQRDDDYYELKLADIYVKAGATNITQVNITDTRLNTNVCGLVIGTVQQLDAENFGAQLDAYITDFISQHDVWRETTQTDVEQWASDMESSYNNWFTVFKNTAANTTNNFIEQANSDMEAVVNNGSARIDKLISDGTKGINDVVNYGATDIDNVVTKGQADIAKVVSDGTTNINNVVTKGRSDIEKVVSDGNAFLSSKQTEIDNFVNESHERIDNVIEDLENVIADNDIAAVVADVANLKSDNIVIKEDIEELKGKVEEPNGMGIEDETEKGCYYIETTDGKKEWINPPNKYGVEYRTTERWNGNAVYQRIIYAASLPNKTVMSIHVEASFDEIISIIGFAIDSDNNLHYQFPIILNGLTPAAVISFAEGDGGDGSDITINTNDDLSSFKAYITIKYTKT